jgi:hypothetical protein
MPDDTAPPKRSKSRTDKSTASMRADKTKQNPNVEADAKAAAEARAAFIAAAPPGCVVAEVTGATVLYNARAQYRGSLFYIPEGRLPVYGKKLRKVT